MNVRDSVFLLKASFKLAQRCRVNLACCYGIIVAHVWTDEGMAIIMETISR